MTNLVLREFAQSLQSLKDSFQPQIEELTQRKSDLSDEIGNLGRQVDKSMQELEQISVKNAQLADLNNRLVHQGYRNSIKPMQVLQWTLCGHPTDWEFTMHIRPRTSQMHRSTAEISAPLLPRAT